MARWPYYRRNGLTLVEVAASIALVGALLVSILIGFSAHQRQVATAANRALAIHQLDILIAEWFAADKFPRNHGGVMTDQPHWHWETTVLQIPSFDSSWQAEALLVEVIDHRRTDAREVLASVELLIERKP
ncbi:MAG: hypothetical protein ABL888_14100 [Pirellulaceae bacterium]